MDRKVLDDLSENTQLPTWQLAGLYLDEMRSIIVTLKQARDGGDQTQYSRSAHSLKGAALSIGAPELADAARMMEKNAISGDDLDALLPLFQQVEAELTALFLASPAD